MMIKRLFVAAGAFIAHILTVNAQTERFDLVHWNQETKQPILIYFSGDGGYNNFSKSLCTNLTKKGFDVYSINSKSYFWKRKSPDQLATDFNLLLSKLVQGNYSNSIFIVGYSFGADCVPFIVNRLSKDWLNKLKGVVMIEPSKSTDLEIYINDLFRSTETKRSLDVVSELNHTKHVNTMLIFGNKNKEFPVSQLKNSNLKLKYLEGDHRLLGNTDAISELIKQIK